MYLHSCGHGAKADRPCPANSSHTFISRWNEHGTGLDDVKSCLFLPRGSSFAYQRWNETDQNDCYCFQIPSILITNCHLSPAQFQLLPRQVFPWSWPIGPKESDKPRIPLDCHTGWLRGCKHFLIQLWINRMTTESSCWAVVSAWNASLPRSHVLPRPSRGAYHLSLSISPSLTHSLTLSLTHAHTQTNC